MEIKTVQYKEQFKKDKSSKIVSVLKFVGVKLSCSIQ